jgi:hypothetical protein
MRAQKEAEAVLDDGNYLVLVSDLENVPNILRVQVYLTFAVIVCIPVK